MRRGKAEDAGGLTPAAHHFLPPFLPFLKSIDYILGTLPVFLPPACNAARWKKSRFWRYEICRNL